MSDLDDIRARLESIADELAEKALDVLRDAVEKGETGRPAEERRLTRARAAVERAMGILGDAPSDDL